ARPGALRAGAGAGGRRPEAGRDPGRLGRRLPPLPRGPPARRRRGLLAGRPLGGRADRVLPDLHAGQRLRVSALRPRRRGPGRPRPAVRARRVRRPAGLAAREGVPAREPLPGGPARRARDRLAPGPPTLRSGPAAEVRRAVRPCRRPYRADVAAETARKPKGLAEPAPTPAVGHQVLTPGLLGAAPPSQAPPDGCPRAPRCPLTNLSPAR